jgi:hypothetical protein
MTSDLIPLVEAAALCPKKRGKRPHVQTLERWIRKGVRSGRQANSPRIKLMAKKDGWQWFTTREWLLDFQDACTAAALPKGTERTPAQRRRDHGFAKRELIRRFGFHGGKDTEARRTKAKEEVSQVPHLQSTG